MTVCDNSFEYVNEEIRALLKSTSDLDVSLTKIVINKLYMVICVPL
jgi:hypothetical protein